MEEKSYRILTSDVLRQRMQKENPDNVDRKQGFALVNVLSRDMYQDGHIPDSINIPKGHEEEFEKKFAHDKEIILYCASTECDASPDVARKLVNRGFTNVYDYEAGLRDWKNSGGSIATGSEEAGAR